MAQKQYVTYDIKKNIKLELNPAFIAGLQQIYARYITEMYNNTENFGQLIKDFNETIMDPEAAKKKNRQFTPIESELYTLYSIYPILYILYTHELMRALAHVYIRVYYTCTSTQTFVYI